MTVTTPTLPRPARASHYGPASTITLLLLVPFFMTVITGIMVIEYQDRSLPVPTLRLFDFAGNPWVAFLPSVLLSLLVLRGWYRSARWSTALNYFCLLLAVAAALFSLIAFLMPMLSIAHFDDQRLESWSAEHSKELHALADELGESSFRFLIVSDGVLLDSDPASEPLDEDRAVQSLLAFANKYRVGYCYFEASILRLELKEIGSAPGIVWLESRDGRWVSGSRGAAR